MYQNELIKKGFTDLEQQYNGIGWNRPKEASSYADPADWQRWATSALNLIKRVLGEDSIHYQNFKLIYTNMKGWEEELEQLNGIFLAARDDYEGGYLFNTQSVILGEIFSDFILLSEQVLREGNKDVAAVLACAALEDALKRFAISHGMDVENKDMSDVVNALKAKGLVKGAQKTLLDTMPKIRNYAMHADWHKVAREDVGSVIGFVKEFINRHFS